MKGEGNSGDLFFFERLYFFAGVAETGQYFLCVGGQAGRGGFEVPGGLLEFGGQVKELEVFYFRLMDGLYRLAVSDLRRVQRFLQLQFLAGRYPFLV